MIFYFGAFYILLGIIFLLIPLIYIELGRPKDFIKAGLNLIIGIILIIKNRFFENSYPATYLLITVSVLIVFYGQEIFLGRWNQLTVQEKKKLISLLELKKNVSKLLEAILLGCNNILKSLNIFKLNNNNENINKKKWVRNDKNDNMES